MNVVEGGVGIAGWVVLVVSLIVMLWKQCSLEKKRCVLLLLTSAFSGFWNICKWKTMPIMIDYGWYMTLH